MQKQENGFLYHYCNQLYIGTANVSPAFQLTSPLARNTLLSLILCIIMESPGASLSSGVGKTEWVAWPARKQCKTVQCSVWAVPFSKDLLTVWFSPGSMQCAAAESGGCSVICWTF
uniref:Uncharacterized protein n=1 Tax=Sphaerodactylus townsendi TaxID=933632 RepID=A0ACB8EFQ9_9SAUR